MFLGIIPGSIPEVRKRRTMICAVNMTEKITRRPPTPWGNEIIRALATNTQNKITGTRIRDNVRKIDLTSGPNTTLPPQKNLFLPFQT